MAEKPRKVLVIGSGPIIIGQAAEFDYSGTQACKALREEGVTCVLVNSNPATIMTDEEVADVVYIEPLTADVLTRIIERERPDGLLPTLGGQTGLNLAVELAELGVLDRYEVRLLGTPLEAIRRAEDRALFKELLISMGEPVLESEVVTSVAEAERVVAKLGLPVVIRPAYTLGGTGGGIAYTREELVRIVETGLIISPAHQVLVERSVIGWKEIEYEVMRDSADNCITVCNMENIDPMGVHTGDSIVVAPSQTLTDREYQMLRSSALKIIRALGVEGGCNIQFALAPRGHPVGPNGLPPYYVIEVNPRVSRSSALASKATGYPIARVAAKIAIGLTLDQIPNAVTGKTVAAFEPALDYCVVKIPRWPFDKFPFGDRRLGTQMKATGEVMAIDRTFEAALQKAVRSLEVGRRSLQWEDPAWVEALKNGLPTDPEDLKRVLPLHPNDLRLWAVMAALRRGVSVELLFKATGIDPWFLERMLNIVRMERRLLSEPLNPALLREAKRLGFSDEQIARLADRLPDQVRELRQRWGIRPVYKLVDTCAAEFEAQTPYFYSTYAGAENEAEPVPEQKALVIGSGPIRIGQGIEFDYCSVHSVWALRSAGVKALIINSNPETVSTDFDTSDRLYFEPLDAESVLSVLENEGMPPAIVQFGGQTAINLAWPLARAGVELLGAPAEAIDLAEDRRRFEDFLSRLGIPQPPGAAVNTVSQAVKVADAIGYPVLVRPSYVLGGRAMEICHDREELIRYVEMALEAAGRHPILIDKYLEGREVEVDAVCDGEQVLIPGIMEHIERAGVHSGDSMAVYPAVHLTPQEVETIVDYTTRIGRALGLKGLLNIQFVIMRPNGDRWPAWGRPPAGPVESEVYVLEVNPRSSRTVPFISKVTGVPMVFLGTRIALGDSLAALGYCGGLWPRSRLVAVKAPVFSMSKLAGVDTYLGPEMKSTGEVMGIDFTFEAALIKALIASGLALPRKGAILLTIADRDKPEAAPLIRALADLGFELYATEGTARFIRQLGLPVKRQVYKLGEGHPNVVDVIREGLVNGVVNTLTGNRTPLKDGFEIRRTAVERQVPCYTSLDTLRAAVQALKAGTAGYSVLPLPEYRRPRGR